MLGACNLRSDEQIINKQWQSGRLILQQQRQHLQSEPEMFMANNHTLTGLSSLQIRLRRPIIELYPLLRTADLEQIPASLDPPQTKPYPKPKSSKFFLKFLTKIPHGFSWYVSSHTPTSHKPVLFNHTHLPDLWQNRGYRDSWGTLLWCEVHILFGKHEVGKAMRKVSLVRVDKDVSFQKF